jgi:hypothetical protein
MQRKVFALLGYYPWECPICRKIRLLHKRGKRVKKEEH